MQISLTAEGNFLLTYASGVCVEVPNSPHATAFLYQTLYNESAAEALRAPRHYPSAKEVVAFMRKQAAERKEQVFADYGIDVTALTISI